MFLLISGSSMRLQLSLREVYGSLRASLRGVEVLRTVLKHFSEFQEVSRASEVAGSFMGRFKVFEGILANFSRVREKSKKFSGGFLKGSWYSVEYALKSAVALFSGFHGFWFVLIFRIKYSERSLVTLEHSMYFLYSKELLDALRFLSAPT